MQRCPRCGAEVFPGASDCPGCGALTEEAHSKDFKRSTLSEAGERRTRPYARHFVAVAIGLALAVASVVLYVAVVMMTVPGSGPSAEYDSFLAAVARGLYLLVGGYAATYVALAFAGRSNTGVALLVAVLAAAGFYAVTLGSALKRDGDLSAAVTNDLRGPLASYCGRAMEEVPARMLEPVRSVFFNGAELADFTVGADFRYDGSGLDRTHIRLDLDFYEFRNNASSGIYRHSGTGQPNVPIVTPTADVEVSSSEEHKVVNVEERRYQIRRVERKVTDRRTNETLGRWAYVTINTTGDRGRLCSPTGSNSILNERVLLGRAIGHLPR